MTPRQRAHVATPSRVHAAPALAALRWPLTSVRRALTNLTDRGLLVHHRDDRRPGPHGARESNHWRSWFTLPPHARSAAVRTYRLLQDQWRPSTQKDDKL